MAIEDGRAAKDELSLERNGFVFVEHKTAVKNFFTPAGAPPRQSIEARALAFF